MKRLVLGLFALAAVGTLGGVLLAQPGGPKAPPDAAIIVVRVPADATLSIGEQTFKQTGPERTLVTPTLKPGTTYSYALVARWKEKGADKTVTRTVSFQAGKVKTVDLTKPESKVKDVDKKDDKKDAKKDEKKSDKKDTDKKDVGKKDTDKKADDKKGADKKGDKGDGGKKNADSKVVEAKGEKKPAGAWTDPKDPKLPIDFAIQGEYVAKEKGGFGVQIIALGGGRFQAVVLTGGLPGAGWDGKNKCLLDGNLEGGKATFKAANGKRKYLAQSPDEFSATSKFPPVGQQDFYAGSADGKTMQLTLSGRAPTLDKIVRASPTLGQKPPPGATILFDGTSADEWNAARVDKTTGLLNTDGHDITTKRRFNNYTVHVEFLLPYRPDARGQGRGNSGFYQVSQYEVQILDSFGLDGKDNECGGIYSRIAPSVNGCLPPLQWQTYDIDFTNAVPDANDPKKPAKKSRITCKLNGITIHDNVEIPGPTGGAWPQPEGTPGPLILQGHGNPLQFRNIWIVEKK
jgi:uncharacterized protein (TIGR03000 family)